MGKTVAAILCACSLSILAASPAEARGRCEQDRLLDILKEQGDSVERANAALELAKIGDRSVTSNLLDAVRPGKDGLGNDWLLRKAVVAALIGLQEVRMKEIRTALSDDSPQVRAVAIEVLALRSPGGSSLAERYLLTDESSLVRAQALAIVTETGSADATKALQRMAAADPDPTLRGRAARALDLAGRIQVDDGEGRSNACGGSSVGTK